MSIKRPSQSGFAIFIILIALIVIAAIVVGVLALNKDKPRPGAAIPSKGSALKASAG